MDTKKWRKRLAALLLGTVCSAAVFSLAACGDKDNEKDPDDKPPVVQVEEFTVTFDANGGTLTGNATVKVKDGAKITGAPTASKEGFTFNGWFTAKTGGTKVDLSAYEVESNITLYAQYTEDEEEVTPPATDTVTVTFDANGGTLTGEAAVELKRTALFQQIKSPQFPTKVIPSWAGSTLKTAERKLYRTSIRLPKIQLCMPTGQCPSP